MPQSGNSRGGKARAKKVVRRKKPYSPPASSRSDAAQRQGAPQTSNTTPHVESRSDAAQKRGGTTGRRKGKTPHVESRSDAAQRQGATSKTGRIRPRKAERLARARMIGDKPFTDAERAGVDDFKTSDEFFLARRAAARARYDRASDAEKRRLFGDPREDAQDPVKLAAFKRDDDRMARINKEELDRELSGEGRVAKFFARAGKRAGSSSTIMATGTGPYGKSSTLTVKAPKVIRKVAEDAINFPAQAVPSMYVPVAGVVEAAQGRPARLKRYVEDVKQTDPIYNTLAAGVESVKGNKRAAKSHIRKAGKSASEHPGFTALEVVGAKGTLGRGTGTVMRSGVAGKKVKAAGSTRRESATVPGTNLVQKREFSRDVFTKGGQVAREKRRIRKAERTRDEARREEDPDRRVELMAEANRQDPRVMSAGQVARRVDERVDANEQVRRVHRSTAQGETRKIVRKVRKSDRPAISVVAQNIVRADKDDIRAYIGELAEQHGHLDAAGKRANERLRRDLQRVVDDPKANLGAVEAAAREYADLTRPLQGKLVARGLLAEGQEAKAALIPYATRNMNATHDRKLGLVDEDGVPLGVNEIRAHMEARGVDDPAFLSQAPNQRGARNFNVRSERAQMIQSRRRTGRATREGTFDADPETLTENAARAQGLVDATDGFRGFVGETAARSSSGKVRGFVNRSAAEKAAANLEAETGIRFRPVRMNPWGASHEQLASFLDDVDADSQMLSSGRGRSPIIEAMDRALDGDGEGAFALIPEEAATRLRSHLNTMASTGELGKTLGIINSNFRRTVLSTSTSWAAGNVVEGAFRAALNRAGPLSYLTGRKALKTLSDDDLRAAEEVAIRTIGGGHYSSADRQHVRRGADQFRGTSMEATANALGKFWRTPGPKQAAGLWHHYTTFVFENMRRIEAQLQTAHLGKAIRQSEVFDDKLIGLSDAALKDVADGLKDTNNVVALGRAVDRAYGKYAKDAPAMRMAKAYYTPFIAWYLNSVKFVFDVLPRDHPTVTALITQAELATEDWRKDHGLDLWMEKAVPGWLQGSIPTGGGGHQRSPNRYLPFAAFGDPLATASGQLLPQFMGSVFAASGLDWTGSPLNGMGGAKPDEGQKAAAVASAFFGGQIPALSLGLRVASNGPSALNPFRETPGYQPKKKVRKSKWTDSGDVLKSRGSSGATSSDSGFDVSDYGSGSGGGIKWSDDTSGFSVSSYR